MDTRSYLRLLEIPTDNLTPTAELLHLLVVQHQRTVPFNNLDVRRKKLITLDLERIFHKVITRREGGLCFELNPLFAWLLQELGYGVEYVLSYPNTSRDPIFAVPGKEISILPLDEDEKTENAEPTVRPGETWKSLRTHVFLLVAVPQGGMDKGRIDDHGRNPEHFLVDVGGGEPVLGIMSLELYKPQKMQDGVVFRLSREGPMYYREKYHPRNVISETIQTDPIEMQPAGGYVRGFKWLMEPCKVEDFQHPLNVTQVDPVLGASSKTIFTMPKDNQRVTLAGSKLIITELPFGKRTERLVQDRDEYQRTLKELFGIDIDVDDKEYPLCIDGDMQSVLGLPV